MKKDIINIYDNNLHYQVFYGESFVFLVKFISDLVSDLGRFGIGQNRFAEILVVERLVASENWPEKR